MINGLNLAQVAYLSMNLLKINQSYKNQILNL